MIYWTAYNNSTYINGSRSAKTMRAAVRAARSYLYNELHGEGKLVYWECENREELLAWVLPIRVEERSIFTGMTLCRRDKQRDKWIAVRTQRTDRPDGDANPSKGTRR